MPRRRLYASGVRAVAIARAQALCRGRRAPAGTAILLVAPLFPAVKDTAAQLTRCARPVRAVPDCPPQLRWPAMNVASRGGDVSEDIHSQRPRPRVQPRKPSSPVQKACSGAPSGARLTYDHPRSPEDQGGGEGFSLWISAPLPQVLNPTDR
jgi:hypothetical protein